MAEYNIGREIAILDEYISLVEEKYVYFLNKHNIDWNDITNIYVANYREILDIDDKKFKLETEEEICNVNARLKDLSDFLQKPFVTEKKKYSELDPEKDYTDCKIQNDTEFYRDLIVSVQGKIGRYILEKRIEDTNDPIYILDFKLQKIKNDLIMGTDKTLDDLNAIRIKIDFIEEFIDEVINKNG